MRYYVDKVLNEWVSKRCDLCEEKVISAEDIIYAIENGHDNPMGDFVCTSCHYRWQKMIEV